jgi:hypothetical protein
MQNTTRHTTGVRNGRASASYIFHGAIASSANLITVINVGNCVSLRNFPRVRLPSELKYKRVQSKRALSMSPAMERSLQPNRSAERKYFGLYPNASE